jgi:hypothetical protein
VGRCGLNAFDSGQGLVASSCEHGSEHFGSGWEFLDKLLRKDSALWNCLFVCTHYLENL